MSERSDHAQYLRPDVRAEPLVHRWYAWTHLLVPTSAAMHVARAHVPILRSYLADPHAHLEAARQGTPLGAPVVTYDALRVAEIQQLLAETLDVRAPMLELAAGIEALDELLRQQADGTSLDRLYAQVPAAVRGLVELVYDRDDHPSVRWFEGLLWRSRYHDPSLQSLSLAVATGHRRPAALNTPRLAADAALPLALPFDRPELDALFATRHTPRRPAELGEQLGLDREGTARLAALLTPAAPPPPSAYAGPGVRIRYLGHASLLVEWAGASVLVDPVINHRYADPRRYFSYDDLPATIDCIAITHGHEDHLHVETLLELRHKTRTVVVPRSAGGSLHDPSLALLLRSLGFGDVREVDDMDRVPLPGGGVLSALPFLGEHGDLAIRGKAAYLLEGGGRSLLCVADSHNVEPQVYAYVREQVGPVDALFVGMECDGSPFTSLYGPLRTRPVRPEQRESRRFRGSDCAAALDLVERFECGHAYVYALGAEPWLEYLMSCSYDDTSRPIVESNRLVEACRRAGRVAERLYWSREIVLP